MEIVLVSNLLLTACSGFLIWFVREHMKKRVAVEAELGAKLDNLGRIATIEGVAALSKAISEAHGKLKVVDTLVEVETRLQTARSEIDTAAKRLLEAESVSLTKRIDHLERQLSEFYWPVYMRLEMDNAIWERLERPNRLKAETSVTAARVDIGEQLEAAFLLPNHREIVAIIQAKTHLLEDDEATHDLLKRYVRHVAIFDALRSAGVKDIDPVELGEPFPVDLFPRISMQAKLLQSELDRLLAVGRQR